MALTGGEEVSEDEEEQSGVCLEIKSVDGRCVIDILTAEKCAERATD